VTTPWIIAGVYLAGALGTDLFIEVFNHEHSTPLMGNARMAGVLLWPLFWGWCLWPGGES